MDKTDDEIRIEKFLLSIYPKTIYRHAFYPADLKNTLELSRKEIIDIEKITDERNIKFYENESYKHSIGMSQQVNVGTGIINFDIFVAEFKNMIPIMTLDKYNILEIGSGNGINSLIIHNIFKQYDKFSKFIATDLYEYDHTYFDIHTGLSSENAVKLYGDESNILMMICPPPECYVDYYAIKEFENYLNSKKYIIYFGEMGLSDGGKGMYHFMMNNSIWKCVFRKIISTIMDPTYGICVKELYLFTNL